ncbi:MAG: NAD(P)/FAD-dependent oxidoreductase [Bacilli bacterium]|nr:NAD(P)/FAD-dependent oxidoreductase [Bacilli bacterium]
MIRVRNIKVPVNDDDVKKYVSKKLKISLADISDLKINKKSIDARKKDNIHFVYEVDILCKNEKKLIRRKDVFITPVEEYDFSKFGSLKLENRPVIIGSGPAGLFCAYMLALNGYNPLVIERGERVEDRIKTVNKFWSDNILNERSNVQFGEGGAGTFSDGKLNTLVKDKNFRMKKVFEIFVKMGAPREIMYDFKPHIGTDILRNVIINLRKEIIKLGGEFRYNSFMSDINVSSKIENIKVNEDIIDTSVLVLAIGHSSRDTYKMLYDKGISMSPKPFAVGVRVQHSQDLINKAQYGNISLPPCSYKLTYNKNGRGVYSFCMCPGGYVVNASSEKGKLAINGMSNYNRDSGVANSAIIVTVSPDDFGKEPLDGISFQRNLETLAYKVGKGKIPIQRYRDFKRNIVSKTSSGVYAFKGDFEWANLNDIYPKFINDYIKEGMEYFGSKISGFNDDDVIIAACESRTSSSVRIERDENFEASIKGIYPCGEGAGYAGGITTSAIDGIKVAEAIMMKYSNFN